MNSEGWSVIDTKQDLKPGYICSSTVAYKNSIYVFGGYNEDTITTSNEFFEFNFILKQWNLITSKNSIRARMGHSSNVIDDKMYIFSGWDNGGLTDLWFFDFEKLTWNEVKYKCLLDTNVLKRYYHSSLNYENEIYFFFGLFSETRKRTNEILKFNPKKETMVRVDSFGDVPSDRSGVTAIVYQDNVYIYGGYGSDAVRYNDLHSFNFKTQTWKKINTIGESPVKTSGQCGVKYEASLFIFGGSYGGNGTGHYSKEVLTYTNNFYKYDLTSQIWKKLGSKNHPSPRSFSSAFIWDDCLYMFDFDFFS
jgi:hypothetical protein